MKKSAAVSGKENTVFSKVLCGVLFGLFICALTDAVLCYFGHIMRVRFFLIAQLLVCLFFAVAFKRWPQGMKKISGIFLGAFFVMAAALFAVWLAFNRNADYHCSDELDKAGLFADRNVMLIVPHEDDELNLLGGAIEEYKSYGSTLRVVFTTNGDTGGKGEKRIKEAVRVLTGLGVPEEDIIFLGYADRMSSDEGYFFNVPDHDAQMYSAGGHDASYGIPGHPAYHEGTKYTRRNFTQDLKNCILEFRPDTIICVDFDSHIDHQSTSLIFEEAMGEILREEQNYAPLVLKAFAYSTAYYARQDFYEGVNVLSTVKPSDSDILEENSIYRWNERLRIPVSGSSLSRSLLNCGLYRSAKTYKTQLIKYQITGMINGDKVFWIRDTSSILYSADITVNSESIPLLNDFRLSCDKEIPGSAAHTDGVWDCGAIDAEMPIRVSLEQPSDISLLRLYDSPSPEDNILSARVVFDSGNAYELGPLAPNGSASEIPVNEKNVNSFVIYITDTEGTCPGLTEIEAYTSAPGYDMTYIKLTDTDGNFVYDYAADHSGEAVFGIYSVGMDSSLSDESCIVSCSNAKCSAWIENDTVRVSCPHREETFVTVTSRDGQVSDTVYVHDSSRLISTGMKIEKKALDVRDFFRIDYQYSDVYKIVLALYYTAAGKIYSVLH